MADRDLRRRLEQLERQDRRASIPELLQALERKFAAMSAREVAEWFYLLKRLEPEGLDRVYNEAALPEALRNLGGYITWVDSGAREDFAALERAMLDASPEEQRELIARAYDLLVPEDRRSRVVEIGEELKAEHG